MALSEAAGAKGGGTVLYWMSRDQRAEDNWALLLAQELALERKAELSVCFCLVPKFLDATLRHFDFMLRGLHETAKELGKRGISFHMCFGHAKDQVPKLAKSLKKPVHVVVCDMSPLRVPKEWSKGVADALAKVKVPVIQVDAHNVVPVWEASDKQEVGARTIRAKIMGRLKDFLTEFPALKKHPFGGKEAKAPFKVEPLLAKLQVDKTVLPCQHFTPGSTAGRKKLEEFIKLRLKIFAKSRNDPTIDALSGLSPWIKFGQVSAQRCALAVSRAGGAGAAAFIEESVVRRELSDNFCFYNSDYDSLKGAAEWARLSLAKHSKDKRAHVYSRQQLDKAETHDPLWNAAQRQMVVEGKMHGFLRMYWAKKILEWSKTPAEALANAIYLNDRYNMDGRDPNGYVGCMWSVCGIHDMGWPERPIFGKIRYMNYDGCKRKFRVQDFEEAYGENVAGWGATRKRSAAASSGASAHKATKKAKR